MLLLQDILSKPELRSLLISAFDTFVTPELKTGLLVLLGAVFFGIAPALRTSNVNLNEVLKHGGRGSSGSMRDRLRSVLAVVEIALATVLLIGAGLFIQSLAHLTRVHLGFDSHGLITFQLAPPTEKYPVTSKARQLYRALLDSLRSDTISSTR